MHKAPLQARLASVPPVNVSFYTLPIVYGECLMNTHMDLGVVELWSGVESLVFAARAAHFAGHTGHQRLLAEGFGTQSCLAAPTCV